MNAQFHKVIFSKRLVAVGEHTSAQKSPRGQGARGAVLAAAVFLSGLSSAYALDPSALPSGHQVAAGQVQVTTSGARMDIGQFTDKAIVTWQSFNVGSGAAVHIHQPTASSVLLNRVVGNDMSQIRGQISANGQVILVNLNGIVMGPSGRITGSAFTASTFGISDTNFLAGNLAFERNGSNASVVNEGTIQTTGETGGYVALIGASVSNQGTIASQGAGVALASGERATVSVPLSGKVRLELDPAAFGSASVANSGVIQTAGGQVFMRAASVVDAVSKIADARVTHTGSIDTTGEQGGRIDVQADHGTVRVSGTITANSASGPAGGDVYIGRDEHTNVLAAVGDASGASLESKGGFVETSGSHLKTTGTRVTALDWLLDPYNITIASGAATTPIPDYASYAPTGTSTILAEDIAANLNAGTNVTITTAGAGSDAGDITVNADIIKATAGTASLTLRADNRLTVNSKIGVTGSATGLNVTLLAGQSSATTTTGQLSIATGGSIEAKAGDVILQTKGGQISTAAGATVTGAQVALDNTNGSIDAVTGLITKGTSAGSSGTNAITIGESITATGQLSMYGLTANNSAISLAAGKTLSGGNIQAVGDSGAVFGFNVGSGASIVTTANSGNNLITAIGRSTGGGGAGTVALTNLTLRAAAGSTLELKGQAVGIAAGAPPNTRGVRIDGVVDTYGAITLTGESGSTEGVLVQSGNINVREGSLTINGTMTPNGGGWRNGITLSRPIYLFNNTDLTIVGKAANTGAMTAGYYEYGVGIGSTISSAMGQTGGDVSITGFTSSAQDSLGVNINSSITTGGSITIVGQNLGNSAGAAARVNANLTSGTGDVTIQSIGGRVEQSSASSITGRHITIDNTGAGLNSLITDTTAGLNLTIGTAMGGSIDGTTKAITSGNGAARNGNGLDLRGRINANGDVNIAGSTVSSTSATAGVYSAATVSGNNITMVASATANTGSVLGYYGAGGVFQASQQLNLTGNSSNAGNGLYSYGGRYLSGTGMALNGSSGLGNAIGMDANVEVNNNTSGGISLTANAADNTQTAFSMSGVSLINAGGSITLNATSGHITADTGNPVWGLGALTNTITQNGAGDVIFTTQDGGNLTVPIIVNNGNGDVVIAAGSNVAVGMGTGGQVLTVSGNTITHNSSGKTYIYTGEASNSGQLNHLSSEFNTLYYLGSSYTLNAQFNTAYNSTIAGGADTQVLFRSAAAPTFSLSLNNISKTYGDADPALVARNTALLSAYTGASTLSTTVNGANSGSNTFAVSAAEVINALTGTDRTAGTNVGSYAYTNASVSAFNTTLSAQPSLVISPRDITLTSVTAASKVYDGNTVATIIGGSFGNIVAGETLAFSGSGYFDSPNVTGVSAVTVDDVMTLTQVDALGLWSNYNITTGAITSSATGKITPTTLTATVNDSSIFVTQLASSAPDMGVSYSGFVNGESSSVLTGTALRSYTGSASYPASGTYAGVFDLSQTPTSGNYQISVVAGDLTVMPADKLLITIQSQSADYGSQTAANLGSAGLGTVTAQYCFDPTNCNGANLVDLTLSKLSDVRWKAQDNTGSHVVFDTSLLTSIYSTGGYLEVGNYSFSATEISPLSLYTNGQPNFTGRAVNAGVLTVEVITLSPSITASDKNHDGTTSVTTSNTASGLTGDAVSLSFVSANFDSATAGTNKTVTVLGLSLSGTDAGNYRLASTSFTTTANIRSFSPSSPSPLPPVIKPLIELANVQPNNAVTAEQAAGNENPFSLSVEPDQCHLNNLSACECETNPLDESLEICYWPHRWSAPEKQSRGQ